MTETFTMLNSENVNDALLSIGILELFTIGREELNPHTRRPIFTTSRSLHHTWDTFGFLMRDYLKAKLGQGTPVLKRRRSMSRNYLRYEIAPNLRGYNFRSLQQNIDTIRTNQRGVNPEELSLDDAPFYLIRQDALEHCNTTQDADNLPGVGRDWRNFDINVERFLTDQSNVHPIMMLNRLAEEIKGKINAANAVYHYTQREAEIVRLRQEEARERERERERERNRQRENERAQRERRAAEEPQRAPAPPEVEIRPMVFQWNEIWNTTDGVAVANTRNNPEPEPTRIPDDVLAQLITNAQEQERQLSPEERRRREERERQEILARERRQAEINQMLLEEAHDRPATNDAITNLQDQLIALANLRGE